MSTETLMRVSNLKKYFPIRKGVLRRVAGHVKAVDDVSFQIRQGETLGMVGESGCGKSTTGRSIIRLIEPTAGSVKYRTAGQEEEITHFNKTQMKAFRQRVQMVFQDPFSSLDPRMSVRDTVSEPLFVHRMGSQKERTEQVKELLQTVGLSVTHLNRFPHQFSGGQRQRIGIARALALRPELIICDEAVSALDVSVQAQILNLLQDLQSEFGLTYMFIAHDLSVIDYISDRIVVMYLGKIVEVATKQQLYDNPSHPYTEALLGAIPIGEKRVGEGKRLLLGGTVPSPANPPPGCTFHTRCPYAADICRQKEPVLESVANSGDHQAACHFTTELELKSFYDFSQVDRSGA